MMVSRVMISMNACKMIFVPNMPFARILMALMTANVMEIQDLRSRKMDVLTLMNVGMNAMNQLRKHSKFIRQKFDSKFSMKFLFA